MQNEIKKLLLLAITAIILITAQIPKAASSTLNFTVATDKNQYGLGETVNMTGNLTSNSTPVEDALIAIEVRDPEDIPFIFRTRPTGNLTGGNWPLNFTQLFPSDSQGNPKYSFEKGSFLYIFFTVKNFDTISHPVIICITLYDPSGAPIGSRYPISTTLDANSSKSVFFLATMIPDSAAEGTATIYANAYSAFPKDGGFPYCPEKMVTFQITESGTSSKSTFTLESNGPIDGAFELTFKIPSGEAKIGNYTIYASSYYQETLVTVNATFEVILIGDINGDGQVNIFDAIALSKSFGYSEGDPNYNPDADLNSDKIINILDAIMFSKHFGEKAA